LVSRKSMDPVFASPGFRSKSFSFFPKNDLQLHLARSRLPSKSPRQPPCFQPFGRPCAFHWTAFIYSRFRPSPSASEIKSKMNNQDQSDCNQPPPSILAFVLRPKKNRDGCRPERNHKCSQKFSYLPKHILDISQFDYFFCRNNDQ